MRISDWSSDVCSSDLSSGNPYTAALFDTWRHWSNACLSALGAGGRGFKSPLPDALTSHAGELIGHNLGTEPRVVRNPSTLTQRPSTAEIGRASCRERVCQYV